MNTKLVPLGTLGLVGAVSLAVIATTGPTTASAEDAYVKREEQATELVLVADDDDDDSNDRASASNSRDSASRNTGTSRSRNDGTNSRHTRVSWDRDRSRGDLTKDWTKDGPGSRTRDHSQNKTNDRSKNDTR